ncbi:cytochrome B [Aliidiomarina taiwanensis]|uniref:Cytochrome B n=1 Tax=Aliidiomarina taiwanensis TaxID=946228 RepID=A0A432WW69_9GAMM|nr:cytochrome b [Aliidiomarina taiwanensis]RUO37989.1 cytochrome B [Aliidiomarina taiwanensis]
MRIKNTESRYGFVSVLLHWTIGLAVIGMFAMGVWMVDLNYYSPWYHKAPALHKSIGVVLFIALLLRLVWRRLNPQVQPLASHSAWEQKGAKLGHWLMYALMFALLISGYLISTADGVGVLVFGLIELPASVYGLPNQADIAGEVHKYLGWVLMGVVAIHALAAIKHHFIDGDATLVRMFGKGTRKR